MTATEDLGVYLAVYLLVLRHPLTVARQILTVASSARGACLSVSGSRATTAGRSKPAASTLGPAGAGWTRRSISSAALDGRDRQPSGRVFQLDQASPARLANRAAGGGGRSEAALEGQAGWVMAGSASGPRRSAAPRRSRSKSTPSGRPPRVSWRHGMTFWCGSATTARRLAPGGPGHGGLYRLPFDKFERFVPYGPPAQVAEFVTPFVRAGATTVNFIPFASIPRRGSTRWPTCESRF